jgi:hypothetical protein
MIETASAAATLLRSAKHFLFHFRSAIQVIIFSNIINQHSTLFVSDARSLQAVRKKYNPRFQDHAIKKT